MLTKKQIEKAAAAIANARGMRRGSPEIVNVLWLLPEKLKAEVMEDALAALMTFETDLRIALEESVTLQSHYASLLNMYDGGQRIGFKNAEAWISRLHETKKLPNRWSGDREIVWERCPEGYEILRGKNCIVHLEPRPPYYDRGRWHAKLEVHNPDPVELNLDGADGWNDPRYYFDELRAKLEIEAWMEARDQLLPK